MLVKWENHWSGLGSSSCQWNTSTFIPRKARQVDQVHKSPLSVLNQVSNGSPCSRNGASGLPRRDPFSYPCSKQVENSWFAITLGIRFAISWVQMIYKALKRTSLPDSPTGGACFLNLQVPSSNHEETVWSEPCFAEPRTEIVGFIFQMT